MKSICYKIQIKPITPFHIGSGELHDPLNLVIKNGSAYYLNQLEYVRFLIRRNKAELEEKMALSDIKQLHKYFADCFDPQEKKCWIFSYSVRKDICTNYQKKMENMQAEGYVRAFIRAGLSMQPIIPGSSIKGAIRTAILSHWQQRVPSYNLRYADKADRELQASILGYMGDRGFPDIPSDPFKAIKIADAPWYNEHISIFEVGVTAPSAPASNIAQLRSQSYGRRKPTKQQTLPILMELALTKPVTESELSIFATTPPMKGIEKILPEGPKTLSPMLKMINEYYRGQFDREESIYKRFGEQHTNNYNAIRDFFNGLKENQCMIKLGMGSGQNYCSYAVMNHNPKTRKLVSSLPMGWMKLSFEPKD